MKRTKKEIIKKLEDIGFEKVDVETTKESLYFKPKLGDFGRRVKLNNDCSMNITRKVTNGHILLKEIPNILYKKLGLYIK